MFFCNFRKRGTAKNQSVSKPKSIAKNTRIWESTEDVKGQRRAESNKELSSVLTRRVPGGRVRRIASLTGDMFLELKLYNVDDIKNVSALDRWEKALISLKFQVDSDSPILDNVNKVLKRCKEEFSAEGTFYADKKQ